MNPRKSKRRATSKPISSEEAIRAGEQIAMAAFASGLKLAAAFGTVAAKTAGLALESLATGADKFSELVKKEAIRSYSAKPTNLLMSDVVSKARNKRSRRKRSGS